MLKTLRKIKKIEDRKQALIEDGRNLRKGMLEFSD